MEFGYSQLPLVNPADSAANQGDVVHFGIQEGTTEALIYSGVFVEKVTGGVSAGNGRVIKAIAQIALYYHLHFSLIRPTGA